MHCCIVLSPFISLHLCCIFSKRREQGRERQREGGSKIKRVKDVCRWCAFWRHAKCATTNNNNKMQKISTTNKKKEEEEEKNKGLCITFRKRKIDYSTLYYASITVCVTHSLISHTLSPSLFALTLRISAGNPSLAAATTTNKRRRHPQNNQRRQQECRSKGGSSCEPCRVCVRVCVCVSVRDYIDFSIKSLPRLVNWFFRSYIIHACVLCVCM